MLITRGATSAPRTPSFKGATSAPRTPSFKGATSARGTKGTAKRPAPPSFEEGFEGDVCPPPRNPPAQWGCGGTHVPLFMSSRCRRGMNWIPIHHGESESGNDESCVSWSRVSCDRRSADDDDDDDGLQSGSEAHPRLQTHRARRRSEPEAARLQ